MDEDAAALGYLLTFRTYGSWVRGDARGSVDRRRNHPGENRIPAVPEWERWQRDRMPQPAVSLSATERAIVSASIVATCRDRGVRLYALNVRSDHEHAVVGPEMGAEKVVNDLKAFATRALRTSGKAPGSRGWSRGASRRRLLTFRAIEAACTYVVERQGTRLGIVASEI